MSDELLRIEAEHVQAEVAEMLRPMTESSLKKAMAEGDMENGAVMAGQIAPLIKEVRPVTVIMDNIMEECKEVLVKMAQCELQ